MIEKIHGINIVKKLLPKNNSPSMHVSGEKMKDDFIKADMPLKKAIEFLENIEYLNLATKLKKTGYWSNGLDFVGYNYANNAVKSVNIGIMNDNTAKMDITTVSTDKFVEILKHLAQNKQKTPEQEIEYKNLYTSIAKSFNIKN